MDSNLVVRALSALAHESRLAIFRMLVVAGPDGMAAGEIAKEDLAEIESALARAIEAAHAAGAKREHAELEAAEANVQRQEKLLAFGRARKSDVARAEQKLAELKAQKN